MRPLTPLLLLAMIACNDKDVTRESDPVIDSPTDDSAASDNDGDGYAAPEDCNDDDPTVHPGAVETCDEQDNNCDGQADEGVTRDYYTDADSDGYGSGEPIAACEQPAGTAELDGDCDDTDPAYHPGAVEADCADPNDYNCDGSVGAVDADNDGFAACEECDDGDANAFPGAVEVCDERDNNCDGQIDEGVSATFYMDADRDGFGDADFPDSACEQPTGYADNADDCDDGDAVINPAAPEVCDGIDNDCDALIDDADPSLDASGATTWYTDADSDGYGDSSTMMLSCTPPSGAATRGDDCDDGDSAVNPGATEVCDGLDNDCDLLIDDADPTLDSSSATTWFGDADSDGYGDAAAAILACDQPSGAVVDDSDCDDSDGAVSPGATELCDGVDNNCDGNVDESSAADAGTWYADSDNDRYGDPLVTTMACSRPSGYRGNDNDCDDGDSAINPGATEVCDSVDNDCDGDVDDADPDLDLSTASTFYADTDGDGYGDPNNLLLACLLPSGGVTDDTDCDDTDSGVGPGDDTDGDGSFDCFDDDDDNDGLSDDDEVAGIPSGFPTDPLIADTDGDGVDDALDPVPTVAACSTALLFYDDFTGSPSTNWTTVSGTWTWDSSDLYANTSNTRGANVWIGSQSWTDYVLQVRMRPDNSNGDSGIMSRVQSVSATNDGNHSYYVGLYPSTNQVTLGYMDGSWHSLVSGSATIDPTNFYTVQIRHSGSSIQVYLDGTQLISTTNTVYSSGSIGFRTYQSPASYDYALACQ